MADNYYHKQFRGVDVYEVGKQQLWDWCGWSVSGPTYGNHSLTCYSYSLAKGSYVVVSQRRIWDVDMQAEREAGHCIVDRVHGILQPGNSPYEKPCVWDANRSLRGAVDFALEIRAEDTTDVVCTDVEVWHIVDDADLWQEWEAMSECAATIGEVVTCLQDVWRIQEGYIPTWLDPIIENAKGQTIREYGYEPVQCSICGDVDFGPWVRLSVPMLGQRYFCEDCKGEAKRHGAILVRG